MKRHEIPIGPRPRRLRSVVRGAIIAIATSAVTAVVIAFLAIRSA